MYFKQLINFYRMQQTQSQSVQLQLVDTSSILNQVINQNCCFDGSNIIYLSEVSLVYHNVFQHNKTFVERASYFDILAMSSHTSGDTSVALAVRVPNTNNEPSTINVQFYFYNKQAVVVDINGQLDVIDMVFLYKNKVVLLCKDLIRNKFILCIVSSHKKIRKIDLSQQGCRLVGNDIKILIINVKGYSEFSVESQSLCKMNKKEGYSIKDCVMVEHDKEVIVDGEGSMHYFRQNQLLSTTPLKQHLTFHLQFHSIIKIGRSLLISYKNDLILSYYQMQDNAISFIAHFEYPQKLRANIISMQSSLDEMNLILAVQVYQKDHFKIQHFLFNLSVLSNDKKFINPFVRLVPNGVEMGEVASLQRTISSSIYYLIGPNIIDYSYVDNILKKHKYSIHQNPKFIAVHPLGHQIICVFEAQVKFYQKIELQLIQMWCQSYVCSAVKFMESGILLLCIFQDNCHQIIAYNSNNFKKIRTYTGIYLKQAISSIELNENESQLILYYSKDVMVYKLKNVQKVSQSKQKKEILIATCIKYDSVRKILLAATNQNLEVCKKQQEYNLSFSSKKVIKMGQHITCIHIQQALQTIFMGTKDGKLLYADYPFNTSEDTQNQEKATRLSFKSMKIHSEPISDILVTNNCKYLFVSVKGDGITILKITSNSTLGKNGYNPYDISNYNFIETSSKAYLLTTHQKLKMLVQKRKTILNEWDQYKKEWEYKRASEAKAVTTQSKTRQLRYINKCLNEIGGANLLHQSLKDELLQLQLYGQQQSQAAAANHHQSLLLCYQLHDQLKDKRSAVQLACHSQYQAIFQDCHHNIKDIQYDLQAKFNHFESNYLSMKLNLDNFQQRFIIERQQQQQVRQEEYLKLTDNLRQQQAQLYRHSSQIKAQINSNQKQIERFVNRKDFLQNKKRFFMEEIKLCESQQAELKQVKQALQQQLSDLQWLTHKKQKRLRKYFMENEVLIKYQRVHANLKKSQSREIQFLGEEKDKISTNINKLQREIVTIALSQSLSQANIAQKKKLLKSLTYSNKQVKLNCNYVNALMLDIMNRIDNINSNIQLREQQRIAQYVSIYEAYYIKKQLQVFISKHDKTGDNQQSTNTVGKGNEQTISEVLHAHKDYLIKNIHVFQKYNKQVYGQIAITSLKHKTQNYSLISECNLRKQQITTQKRILHKLVWSVRETSAFMTHLQTDGKHSNIKSVDLKHRSQTKKNTIQTPCVMYEKYMEGELKENELIVSQKSESALWTTNKQGQKVSKMLSIKRIKGMKLANGSQCRRIKTGMIKKKPSYTRHEHEVVDEQTELIPPINYPDKPRTALHQYSKTRRHIPTRKLLQRKQPSSKPTTSATHYHSKASMFI